MSIIDLRSDTVTQPTDAMRQAMAIAPVGDDVFGEDPTIERLQTLAASRLGKDAALYVASGTMANLLCQMAHCRPGDEMIVGDQAHIYYYEQGGSAAVAGIHPRALVNQPDGQIPIKAIQAAIRPDNIHFPRTRLIALENTHNRCSGMPLPLDYLQSIRALADTHQLKIHVDGARIFNAAAALGVPPREMAASADSLSFCLSKGLAAPVGSMICGDTQFVETARRLRKRIGGGMRQAGVIAAAGIVSLEEMVERLVEDHTHARQLAEGLDAVADLTVDLDKVVTNIAFFEILRPGMDADRFCEILKKEGILMLPVDDRRIRAVTHYHIETAHIEQTLNAVQKVLSNT